MTASGRAPLGLYVAAAVFLVAMALVVGSSLARVAPQSYAPSPLDPSPAPARLIHDTVTVDARREDAWSFFDFDRRSVVEPPDTTGWDLALRRFHLIVNGGEGLAGGGALALSEPWDSIDVAPEDGYVGTRGGLSSDAETPSLARWYRYSFFSHTLSPKEETYVVRTVEGRYAKFRVLSYYCPEAMPGCLTLEYAYQGDGGVRLTP